MKESRARWLARLGRTLLAVPEIDRAHAEGRISAAQVVVLAGIVDAATPAEERVAWIERATRMTVRSLAKAVQAEKRRRAEEVAAAPAPEKAAADDAAAVDAAVADATQAPPAGGWMTIAAPARAALVWQEAIELARKASGRHLTQGQCAEAIFAEYLSAHPEAAAEAAAEDTVPAALDPLVAEVIAALNERAGSARDRIDIAGAGPSPAATPGSRGMPSARSKSRKPASAARRIT